MKKLLFGVFSVFIFTVMSFASGFYVDNGEKVNIEFDKNRKVKEVYVKWQDFGADAEGTLLINGEPFGQIEDIKTRLLTKEWVVIDEDIQSIEILIEYDKAFVKDLGVFYEDTTPLEKNMVKYNFELKKLNLEENFELKDYMGDKYVMLQFFQVHCIACQEKLPYFTEFTKQYKNTHIIVVNAGDPEESIIEFFKNKDIEVNCILDTEYRVAEQLEVYGVPHTIVFDKEGNKIVSENLSKEGIQEQLDIYESEL